MARTVQLTVPASRTDDLVAAIEGVDGLLGLQVVRGVARKPPGDVITVAIPNSSSEPLMRLLEKHGVAADATSSMSTSEPIMVVAPPQQQRVIQETGGATWEEMHLVLGRASNMTPANLAIMAISGVLAAIGLATDSLHLVIAAMLIAPGFEPLVRIGLGIIARNDGLRSGLRDTALGYAVLTAAAFGTGLVLRWLGFSPLGGPAAYLPQGALIAYWSSPSVLGALASGVAGVGGAILIWTDRAILTTGVMVALALIPTLPVAALALLTGQLDIAGQALLRWLIDVALVVGASLAIFYLKRSGSRRARSLL